MTFGSRVSREHDVDRLAHEVGRVVELLDDHLRRLHVVDPVEPADQTGEDVLVLRVSGCASARARRAPPRLRCASARISPIVVRRPVRRSFQRSLKVSGVMPSPSRNAKPSSSPARM